MVILEECSLGGLIPSKHKMGQYKNLVENGNRVKITINNEMG